MPPPKLRPGSLRLNATRTEARTAVSRWHTVPWWAGHHLDREDDGEWKDNSGWGAHRTGVLAPVRGVSREDRRDEARLGRYAQELRAERETSLNREEYRAFFGEGEGAYSPVTERRIRVTADEARRSAYEEEQAARYSGRRRRGEAALRRIQQKGRV